MAAPIPSIGNEILSQTGTKGIAVPPSWPGDRGPVSSFTQVPQMLLAGDRNGVIRNGDFAIISTFPLDRRALGGRRGW
jgi:hypothetical protein